MDEIALAFPEVAPVETTELPEVGSLAAAPAAPVTAPAVAPAEAVQQPLQTIQAGPFRVPASAPSIPAPPPAAGDPDVFTADGLSISYRGRKDVPYGRTATANAQPFSSLVVHHTGIDDLERSVQYGHVVDQARGGSFGYHFYIGKDGSVVQGAPMSSRTNHLKDPSSAERKAGKDIANHNAVSISMIGSGNDHTPAQIAAAEKLARALQTGLKLDPSRVYGHGELQSDRQSTEGMSVVERVRGGKREYAARIEPALNTAIASAAASVGVNADYLRVTSLIESRGGHDKRTSSAGAVGPFQFIPSTWQQYGEGGDPTNPVDASVAAARLAKANSLVLKNALKRDPSNAELYVAHQQGATGASMLMASPDKLASDIVGLSAVAGNLPIPGLTQAQKMEKARTLTAGQFVDLIKQKFDKEAGSEGRPNGVSYHDITRPPQLNLAPGWTQASLEAQRGGYKESAASFANLYVDAFSSTSLASRLTDATPSFAPVAGWAASREELKAVPERLLHAVSEARSPEEFHYLKTRAMQREDTVRQISEAGAKGTAAFLLAGLTDPVPWVAGTGFGMVADAAVNIARLGGSGSRIVSAVGGAAGNLAADVAIAEMGNESITIPQALFSTALGGAIGATVGHIGSNRFLSSEANQIRQASHNLQQELLREADTSLNSSTSGAALSAGAALSKVPYEAQNMEQAFNNLSVGDMPKAAIGGWRITEGGKAAASPNEGVRGLGGLLGVDVTGKAKGADGLVQVNAFSADQEMRRVFDVNESSWKHVVKPAYEEWAKANGITRLQRLTNKGWTDFQEQIFDYVSETNPLKKAEFPKTVQNAGNAASRLFGHLLEEQQNPGKAMGLTYRPVVGSENVARDANWLPHQWDAGKMDDALHKHGLLPVVGVVSSAIKKAQPALDDDLAETLGRAIVVNKINRAVGLDDRLGRAVSTADRELMKDFLRDSPGVHLSDTDIDRLFQQLSPTIKEGAKDARFMRRIDLDRTHSVVLPSGPLAIKDLMNTNVDELFSRYNRQASGSIALARTKVTNPRTGEVLIDGITSDADFEAAIRNVQKWEIENKHRLGDNRRFEDLETEVKGLRWMYDRVKGRPDPAQMNDTAKWLGVIRKWNTARLMGGVGFAQLMDIGRPAGAVGLKAMLSHMSSLKKVMSMDGESMMLHGFDREVEVMFGATADHVRVPMRHMREDLLNPVSANASRRAVDKADEIAGAAADVTMTMSGFHLVNQGLKMATYKAILQKFSDNAEAAMLSKGDINTLRFSGLDDAMTQRIFEQFKKHTHTEKGALLNRKIVQLGWENWDDLEARVALQRSVFRLASNLVQENDVGGLHRYMSHPMAQTLLQFRMFNVYAYENMMLRGLANGDMRQFSMAMSSLLSGALIYSAQTQLQAIGRSDRQQFLEDRMGDPGKVALAAFGRAGWTSILPMAVDTVLLGTPYEPLFGNSRASGQASDAILGNSTVGLFNDGTKAVKAASQWAFDGGTFTQPEARNMQRLIAWQNLMGPAQAASYLISGLPEK